MMFGLTSAPAPAPTVVVVNGGPAAPMVSAATPGLDPIAVQLALEARGKAANTYVSALEDLLAAEADYRAALNQALVDASGPEYLRKAVAEQSAAVARAARDAAEVAKVAAEEAKRLAELAWRSAMAGAAPDGGDRP